MVSKTTTAAADDDGTKTGGAATADVESMTSSSSPAPTLTATAAAAPFTTETETEPAASTDGKEGEEGEESSGDKQQQRQDQHLIHDLEGRHFRITVLEEGSFLQAKRVVKETNNKVGQGVVYERDADGDDGSRHRRLNHRDGRLRQRRKLQEQERERDHDVIDRFDSDEYEYYEYSGYLIDMIHDLASLANFTYELKPPSGLGSQCAPQVILDDEEVITGTDFTTTTTNSSSDGGAGGFDNNEIQHQPYVPYDRRYRKQYNCGTDDVNELQNTTYASDMYLGMFYMSLQRMERNWFTIPFEPPYKGTPAMVGTTTGIASIGELIQAQHRTRNPHPPMCVMPSTAYYDYLRDMYPDLKLQLVYGIEDDHEKYLAMHEGTCPVMIGDAPVMAKFVLDRKLAIDPNTGQNECYDRYGMPIGLIGEPLDAGLSHYSIGVGRHIDYSVVETMSYWLNVLMINGTLATHYNKNQGGTGDECGYVLYPMDETYDRLLSVPAIVGVVAAAVAVLIILPLLVWHAYRLKKQEKRYKKRFVQQIARNIEIGRNPGCIDPKHLTEEVLHIAQGKNVISKDDLERWMFDIKMNFISKEDFEALWNAMDINQKGEVDAVEFIVFLSACGPEFEEVYEEQLRLPKIEKLKLAARRLTNLTEHGENGVRLNERRLDRSSRNFEQARLTRKALKGGAMDLESTFLNPEDSDSSHFRR